MKRAALVVLYILAGGFAPCQDGFIVQFDSVQAGYAAGGRSVFERNWGYLVFGHQVTNDGSGRTRCMAYRLGPAGGLLSRTEWDTSAWYDYNFGFADPIALTTEGFASGVSRFNGTSDMIWLYSFDSNGELLARDTVLYCCTTDSVDFGVRYSRATSDGGFVMTGYWDAASTSAQCLLVKADSNRHLEWWRTWGPDGLLYSGYGVEQYPDGGYVVTGIRLGSGLVDRSWLRRTDAEGNMIWDRAYGNFASNGESVRIGSDGSIFTWSEYQPDVQSDSKYVMLRKWTPGGAVVWEKQSHFWQWARARDFELLEDGTIITTGGRSTFSFIAKFEIDGDSLWSRDLHAFSTWATAELFDVTPTSDGGFVLTGNVIQADADPTPTLQTLWVVKTDSLGCVIPGCQNTGVQEYVMDLQQRLRVSPNPANDLVSLALDLPEGGEVQGQAQVQLLDATGRVVLEHKVQQNLNKLTATMDVSALPAGTYYLHLRDAKRWLAGSKVVVQ